MNAIKIVWLSLALAIVACSPKKADTKSTVRVEQQVLKPRYAKFFDVLISSEDTVLRIFNPWKNGVLMQEIKFGGKAGLSAPLKSLVPMSTSFYGYLDLLGDLDKVVGIENRDFVYNQHLTDEIAAGKISELGQSGVISVERTIQLNPNAVIISGTEVLGPNLQKIQQAGIPVINNMDWQEQHPLGKAEWIKVFGLLTGKYEAADSIFTSVEKQYHALSNQLKKQLPAEKLAVLLGYNYQGTWFMPGGKSYVAQYLADAGADYAYRNDSSSGSLPLSSELVYKNFMNTPIWLNPGSCKSLADLLMLDARYKNFAAFKTGQVYNNNLRSNSTGGNDFWESSPANPHLVLADLVHILYPKALPGHKLYFYQRLQ